MHRISGQVRHSVTLAEEASALMGRIGESSLHAVSLVGEITHAVTEQTAASQLIAGQVEQGSASANRSADAAREVDHLAHNMRQIVAAYRL